ncbi:MAG TPA: ABC transporter substrate-binding protein [Actinocrinis sp.]|nr:ABC transporter substrate-binding protein [Actinocrinis sp.]
MALTAAACGSSTTPSTTASGGTSSSFNLGLTTIVNPQSGEGGTLTYLNNSDFDSIDPGNTYDAFSWDIGRLWARPLLTYSQKPGAAGDTLVPDLAAALPTSNSDGTVWTFHLQTGATFQNGTPITSADVKYGIERSNWGADTLSNGPSYFKALVQDTTSYKGPYLDKNAADGVSGIATPDAHTIVFTLNQPFAAFPDLATLADTAPVPRASDTGATYYQHIVSSGQYEIQSYTKGQQLVLVPNPNFAKASDPNGLHQVHASKIVVKIGVDQTTVDNSLLANQAQVDLGGVGVAVATQSKILSNPTLKADSDNPLTGFMTYMSINTTVKPFDNLDCRQAVEWAINKVQVQSAQGGSIGGGAIATTIIPPTVAGYVKADVYQTPGEQGSVTNAKASLAKCAAAEPSYFTGSASTGFTLKAPVGFGSFSDQPKMKPTADAIQQNLQAVGISTNILLSPFGDYFHSAGGNDTYVSKNDLALSMTGWGADFPQAYGFVDEISTKDGIQASGTGTTNLSKYDDPAIDAQIQKALGTLDQATSNAEWGQIDQALMNTATIVPLIDNRALFYRPASATNVYVQQAYGMYDYSAIGVSGSN